MLNAYHNHFLFKTLSKYGIFVLTSIIIINCEKRGIW